jgi:threonylcarbamoyladenosine tRNA methylthiotransferase MtaB
MPTVSFITLGCKVNHTETESMAGLFRQRGYIIVEPSEAADVYVINTCSVTHLGERKSRQMVRRAIRSNPDAIVAVTGCFAQISPQEASKISGVDVIVGTTDRSRIVDFVEKAARENKPVLAVRDIMDTREFEDIPLSDTLGRTRAFLKIQDGCDNYCSYCIIPYARGHLRSRSIESIRRESSHLADLGFKEIVLTGINLGAYGRETAGFSLADAVRTVLEEDRIARVRLSSTDSLEVSGALIELLEADARLCPHLHLPLQSGEDSVLAAMRRPYTTKDFARLADEIRGRVTDLALTTDIIVGFPGETADSFARTLEFAAMMDFAKIHVFPYSRRAGTPAASLNQQIGDDEKKRRVAELTALGKRSGENFRRRFLGREMPVLVETVAEGVAEGLTPNYQRVWLRGAVPDGAIVGVELQKLFKEGFWGKLI